MIVCTNTVSLAGHTAFENVFISTGTAVLPLQTATWFLAAFYSGIMRLLLVETASGSFPTIYMYYRTLVPSLQPNILSAGDEATLSKSSERLTHFAAIFNVTFFCTLELLHNVTKMQNLLNSATRLFENVTPLFLCAGKTISKTLPVSLLDLNQTLFCLWPITVKNQVDSLGNFLKKMTLDNNFNLLS